MVRHGRTQWNADGRFQGHSDIPLNERGLAEAAAAARALSRVEFDAIVSSDLLRAFETASAIAQHRAIAVERDERLREIRFGVWEGLTWAQISERFPEAAAVSSHDPRFYVHEGGETFAAVKTRVGAALDDLKKRSGRICLVAHAGVIHAALSVLFSGDSPSHGLRLDSGSISHIRFTRGQAGVVTLNDASHLTAV